MKDKITPIIREALLILKPFESKDTIELINFIQNLKKNAVKNGYKKYEKIFKKTNPYKYFNDNSNLLEKWSYLDTKIYNFLRTSHNKFILKKSSSFSPLFLLKSYQKIKYRPILINKQIVKIVAIANFHSNRNKIRGKTIKSFLYDLLFDKLEKKDGELNLEDTNFVLEHLGSFIYDEQEMLKRYKDEVREDFSRQEIKDEEINFEPNLDELFDHFAWDDSSVAWFLSQVLVWDLKEPDLDKALITCFTDLIIKLLRKNQEYITNNMHINIYFNISKSRGSCLVLSKDLAEITISFNEDLLTQYIDKFMYNDNNYIQQIMTHELAHLRDWSFSNSSDKRQQVLDSIRKEAVSQAPELTKIQFGTNFEGHSFAISNFDLLFDNTHLLFILSDFFDENRKDDFKKAISTKTFNEIYYNKDLIHLVAEEIMLTIFCYMHRNKINGIKGSGNVIDLINESAGGTIAMYKEDFQDYELTNLKKVIKNRYNEKYSIYFEKKELESFARKLRMFKVERFFKKYKEACKYFKIESIITF